MQMEAPEAAWEWLCPGRCTGETRLWRCTRSSILNTTSKTVAAPARGFDSPPRTQQAAALGSCQRCDTSAAFEVNPEPRCILFFVFTLVTGPRRSFSLKLSDKRVYAPQIRARDGCRMAWLGALVARELDASSDKRSLPKNTSPALQGARSRGGSTSAGVQDHELSLSRSAPQPSDGARGAGPSSSFYYSQA